MSTVEMIVITTKSLLRKKEQIEKRLESQRGKAYPYVMYCIVTVIEQMKHKS